MVLLDILLKTIEIRKKYKKELITYSFEFFLIVQELMLKNKL